MTDILYVCVDWVIVMSLRYVSDCNKEATYVLTYLVSVSGCAVLAEQKYNASWQKLMDTGSNTVAVCLTPGVSADVCDQAYL